MTAPVVPTESDLEALRFMLTAECGVHPTGNVQINNCNRMLANGWLFARPMSYHLTDEGRRLASMESS